MPTTSAVPVADVRARWAVAALFLTNGALFANLVPRYPEIKVALDLGNAAYGLAVAAFPAGAITAGLAAAPLIRRYGSGRLAVAGTLVTALAVAAAGSAPTAVLLGVALFLGGAADAVTDVAQNAHGLRVQRRYGRSIINSFHAVWSMGAVLGGGMAAGAIALGLPRPVHLTVSGGLFALVSLATLRFTLPGRDDEADVAHDDPAPHARRGSGRTTARTVGVLAALVLIATAGTLVEDAGSTWAALYLGTALQAPPAVAATGFVAVVGAQFVGRVIGDRLVDRFGQRAVARAGGLVLAIGMGQALAVPTTAGTLVGLAAAGFGVATLVPAAMHEADGLPGLRAGTGLAVVSWLMRLGFLISPPLVGLVADAAGLRVGLLVVPLVGVVVLAASSVLSTRATATSGPGGPSADGRAASERG